MAKVALISNKDNNFYNFRSELILSLIEEKYEVLLICPYGKKIDYFTERGCRFLDVDVDRRGKSVFKDLSLLKKYRKILKTEKPDIVLTFTTKSSIYGGYICRKLKIPYIVNNAGLMETHGLFKIFMDFLYTVGFKKANCIMFQNSHEMNYIERLLKWRVPYKQIPGSGVNLEKFSFVEYPENDVIIFNFVARIARFKGIEEYLECAKIIKQSYPNTEFRIFGDYDEIQYKTIIENYEQQGIVKYYGVQMDMKPYIAVCNAAIHPSHYEGMTNVVLEHGAMGRPCIGSNIPGVKEGIDDKKTGFMFQVKNTADMVATVENFLKLSILDKKEMGIKARHKMETEFDRRIVTNTYLNCIDEIARNE